MRRRATALAIVERGGAFFLHRARGGEAAEEEAGPFATRLDAERERTTRMLPPRPIHGAKARAEAGAELARAANAASTPEEHDAAIRRAARVLGGGAGRKGS